MKTFKCMLCEQDKECLNGLTTGYGMNSNLVILKTLKRRLLKGDKICFQCCATQDLSYMYRHGKIDLYWDGEKITNWPGTLTIKPYAIKSGKHNIAGTRQDVWFMHNEKVWHGVQYGEMTQIIHCKETKQCQSN